MPTPKGHPPYCKKGQGGRKVKYTKEFIDNEADALNEWKKKKENIFIGDFCEERGYHFRRMAEWVKVNEKFSLTYEMFQMKQMTALLKGGLVKKFAHPMCALILGHSHGIIAVSESKITGDPNNPLSCLFNKIDGTSKNLINEKE